MTQIISVHSFRSEAGKSLVSTNLAVSLALAGLRVGIVDIDFQAPSIHIVFDLGKDQILHSINDYLWGKCEITEAVYDVTNRVAANIKGRIFLIPSSMKAGDIAHVLREGYDVGLLNDGFRSLNQSLNLDFLIIRTRPGLNEETLLSIAISSTVVEVMRPDERDYLGTAVFFDVAHNLDVPSILLVINKIPRVFDIDDVRRKAEQLYSYKVAAMLPFSEDIMASGGSGIFSLQYPNHAITLELKSLSAQIISRLSRPSGQSSFTENQTVPDVQHLVKRESVKLASFDLEIAKILPENANNILDYAPLGISCAALAIEDKSEVSFWQGFPQQTKRECQKLVWDLIDYTASGYTLVTWNGCNFDFRVLAQESGMVEECGQLALNHVDLMFIVTCTKGWFLGLDKALSGAGISGKVKKLTLSNGETLDMSGALAPVLWAKQEYNAVLTYLKGDVAQTLELAKNVQGSHAIRWVSGNGKSQSVSVPHLLTVKECFRISEPDTSWMKDPPRRETFVEWIPNWKQQI